VSDGFYACGLGSVIVHGVSSAFTSVAPPGTTSPDATRLSFAPNPTSGHVTIQLVNEVSGQARLRVFDIRGREVASVTQLLAVGPVSLAWDGRGMAPGIYFAAVTLPSSREERGRFVIAPR
jgi:hypothetical protein